MHPSWLVVVAWSLSFGLLGLPSCTSGPTRGHGALEYAIAIHGGAGTIDREAPAERLQAYRDAMRRVLTLGRDMLAEGSSALDVCEAVVRNLEDDPLFNAGKGAVFNDAGQHELDASIMDGSTLRCGAVAGVRTVRHPITLARKVMTETRHVLLAGDGADAFAKGVDVELVDNSWFDTPRRRRALERALEQRDRRGALVPPRDRRLDYGTVGCVVRDRDGKLAAATSTGGMTAKRWGRIGDSPILGAGNYADRTAAISCTGTGEEFMRHAVARSITARMEFGGQSLEDAAHEVVHDVLRKGDGGLIAVDKDGNIATPFNSSGMYRATADSSGRFEVAIFADEK
ncbi:MAG: isoaspartyl peptidase/L-asparaginase [Planctomycetes bacterium]|nr:isoaspartyl peptidase/L-asparaginase [Planctomycetota bacterium]